MSELLILPKMTTGNPNSYKYDGTRRDEALEPARAALCEDTRIDLSAELLTAR